MKTILIVGPTSSGKTNLAINIASAFDAEIISADAFQIYKEFNICTAKPTSEQLLSVRHHFINHISVTQDYSAARFSSEARGIVSKIASSGKIPIISGGSGLYIDSLIHNFQFSHSLPPAVHKEIINKNNLELFEELKKKDPESAKIIDPHDLKRIRRALVFFCDFGFSITSQKENTIKSKDYETIRIGLNFKDRNLLYKRINERVDKMLENGLIEEVKSVSENFRVSRTASAAIGYKEIVSFISGITTLKEAIESIKTRTRHYAKRQITWFKREYTKWFYVDETVDFESILNYILEKLK